MKHTRANDPQAMRLQGIGWVQGTPAQEAKEGDIFVWNFGHTSKVVRIEKQTSKTITIVSECNGKEYIRQYSKTRLLCIKRQ